MVILQAGLGKSGNFWLYKVLEHLLDLAGEPRRSYIRNHAVHAEARSWPLSFPEQADIDVLDIGDDICETRISSRFRETVDDLDAYLAACRHVWTHSKANALAAQIFPRFDRIFYVLRDPRDVVLSQADFRVTDYMRTYYGSDIATPADHVARHHLRTARNWLAHVRSYLEAGARHRVRFVFYERLLHDFDATVRTLAADLGLEPDRQALEAVRAATSFDALRPGRQGHLNKGRWGRWRDELTAAQAAAMAEIVGPLLQELGYPLHASGLDGHRLPELPACVRG